MLHVQSSDYTDVLIYFLYNNRKVLFKVYCYKNETAHFKTELRLVEKCDLCTPYNNVLS